ncbi:uncharacterized protein LOC107027480 [Solanum pennellii]|uniref:Uncharacterized protein LOC107027480 n=1 Tax=Solanum pennellii TaxID=28526 RepID=A0ABM1HE07_SOLPN|nr:uncharacterized protein LOC107027480 [Solanum pennellii]
MSVHKLLVIRDSDLLIHHVQGEWALKNAKTTPYVQYIQKLCKRFCKIEFRHAPGTQNELVDALSTIASMIKNLDTDYIGPPDIELKEHLVHCLHVEAELDNLPWYFDTKKYFESEIYSEDATSNQKKLIRRMALNFFLSGEVLYRSTPDLGLLRCIDVVEIVKLIEQIHAGVCVAIDYFTKWVEAASYKSVTKEVVADFVRNNLIYRIGVTESIITDNDANLNSHLMRDIRDQLRLLTETQPLIVLK